MQFDCQITLKRSRSECRILVVTAALVVLFIGHQQLFDSNVDVGKTPCYFSNSVKECRHSLNY